MPEVSPPTTLTSPAARSTLIVTEHRRKATVRDFAVRIARGFALPADHAFAGAEAQSLALCARLRRLGVDARRCRGDFHPSARPERWQESRQTMCFPELGFAHYWVRVEHMLLDAAAAQFGEADLVVTTLSDPRYVESDSTPEWAVGKHVVLNETRVPGAICFRHALNDVASSPTHVVSFVCGSDLSKLYVCAPCGRELYGGHFFATQLVPAPPIRARTKKPA